MATAFFKMSRSAAIAPVAQHRGGDAKLACDLEQRPTAAHQHSDRLLLEFIRKLTPSWAHSTPFPLPPELSKSVHQFGGASRSGDARAGPIHSRTFTGTSGSSA